MLDFILFDPIGQAEITAQLDFLVHEPLVHVFASVILLDIALGYIKSFVLGVTDSGIGIKGIIKHAGVILVVFAASVYLPLLGFSYIAKALVLYLIVSYLISLVESWGEMGLPLPPYVKQVLIKLRSTLDTGQVLELKNFDNAELVIKKDTSSPTATDEMEIRVTKNEEK